MKVIYDLPALNCDVAVDYSAVVRGEDVFAPVHDYHQVKFVLRVPNELALLDILDGREKKPE